MKLIKGKEFLLLCIIFVICIISTSTYGINEEIFALYPILIPMCLKCGIDVTLVIRDLYISIKVGSMLSTFNPFSVVIVSYSSEISFSKEILQESSALQQLMRYQFYFFIIIIEK